MLILTANIRYLCENSVGSPEKNARSYTCCLPLYLSVISRIFAKINIDTKPHFRMIIKKIDIPASGNLADVPALLDAAGVGFAPVSHDNWHWSDRNPVVKVRAAHASDFMVLHFHVSDNELRAVETADDGRVWEDSCVEFFVSPEGNDFYYNFECNCIGTLLLHGGPAGGDRPSAPSEVYGSVRRWSSLGTGAFEAHEEVREWDLVEMIPASALFRHDIKSFDGLSMKGNFYKCGDLLPHPHFLSWAPIELPKPMFHCPQFFDAIEFEQ